MNSLQLHNMLSEHRRNVLRLLDIDPDLKFADKMKLIAYTKHLRKRLDDMAATIQLEFIRTDANQQVHNTGGSHQEPDGDTVGTFKHARLKGD
jgi:hypothetical protein